MFPLLLFGSAGWIWLVEVEGQMCGNKIWSWPTTKDTVVESNYI